MTRFPPLAELARAKVNLTLRVLGRRADGFHELDSLVAFADVGDAVTLEPGAPAAVVTSGPFAGAIDGENLAARALSLIAAAVPGLRLGAVAIDKQLPVAAGLGGGSADAAAVLRLFARANPYADIAAALDGVAARLGSDVPVCVLNRAARMTGRGETVAAIADFPALAAVLVNPRVPVPSDKTRQVFAQLAAARLAAARPAVPAPPLDWHAAIAAGGNDLEVPATAVMPVIADVLAALRAGRRTQMARLSGAGPTCFALLATDADAAELAADLRRRQPTWWVRATRLG